MAETRSKPERKLPYIKRTDLLWLAGLAEGEACFNPVSMGKERKKRPVFRVSMTDEDVVQRIANLLNSNVLVNKDDRPNRKTLYYTAAVGQKAVELMCILHPLMGKRRKMQIEESIKHGRPEWAAEKILDMAM